MTRFAIAVIFAASASFASAQTIETNITGLVIKNYSCFSTINNMVSGDLINRTTDSFGGKLRVKIVDVEGDIVFQTTEPVRVSPQNGSHFVIRLSVGKCTVPNKVQFTLER